MLAQSNQDQEDQRRSRPLVVVATARHVRIAGFHPEQIGTLSLGLLHISLQLFCPHGDSGSTKASWNRVFPGIFTLVPDGRGFCATLPRPDRNSWTVGRVSPVLRRNPRTEAPSRRLDPILAVSCMSTDRARTGTRHLTPDIPPSPPGVSLPRHVKSEYRGYTVGPNQPQRL